VTTISYSPATNCNPPHSSGPTVSPHTNALGLFRYSHRMNPRAHSSGLSTDRDHALARFLTIRSQTEDLADPLSPEDQTAQSMPNCSPTKWHRAHTTWFFEEFLLDPQLPNYPRVHSQFRYLFNSYYEAVGPRQPRPQRGLITRPSAEEIRHYRITVNAHVSEFLSSQSDQLPRNIADIVELGVNHEQQHQELLLMDIKHLLSHNCTNPRYANPHEDDGVGRPDDAAATGDATSSTEPAHLTETLTGTASANSAPASAATRSGPEGLAGDGSAARAQDRTATEPSGPCRDSTPTAGGGPKGAFQGPRRGYKVPGGDRHATAEPTGSVAPDQDTVQSPTWSSHPGGLAQIGHQGVGFSFDNETPRHQVWLEPFQIADRVVTVGQWLDFMADSGYERAEFWLSDGWAWVNQTEAQAPLYWQECPAGWHQFTLHGLQPIDRGAPVVHVNYYEADAFARWADARLPTESEWETTATAALPQDRIPIGDAATSLNTTVRDPLQNAQPRGAIASHARASHGDGAQGCGRDSGPTQGNLEQPHGTPSGLMTEVPSDAGLPSALHPVPADPDHVGIQQLFGSVWQWTSSAYSPYPGFQPAAGAVGEYNGKFMVDLQVLRGGSCITPVGHSRPTYRNFFHAASQWPFTGLRLARNA
jgi:ergothioneine biosynthesis protein EgtB